MRAMMFPAAAAAILMSAPASAATLLDFSLYARGNAWISGGGNGNIGSATFSNTNGVTAPRPAAPTNYTSWSAATDALSRNALDASARLAAQASTGGFSTEGWSGNVILTGTTGGVNVFNLTAAQYAQINQLTFRGSGTGAIVNVAGDGSFDNFVNINGSPFATDRLIFNFAQASGFQMGGFNLNGTLLAPNATVTLKGGNIGGSVIGGHVNSDGAFIGGVGFSGLAATQAVPEPATWATMIAGFALVGFAMRRRRHVVGRGLATA